MTKKLLRIAIAAIVTLAFAVPAFANPFADVPQNHWAYDAVNKLVATGIVDGYGDGTFRGDKTMTRYEMAQIVAKAMAKNVSGDQKEIIDRLAGEFGEELKTLGVKVAALEKEANRVKFSGDARIRYFNTDGAADKTDYRYRLNVAAKVNDNISLNARFSTDNVNVKDAPKTPVVDNAYAQFKVLGLDNKLGLQDIKLGNGLLADTQMTGIATKLGAVTGFTGRMSKSGSAEVAGAELKTKLFGMDLTANYLNDSTAEKEYASLTAGFNLLPNVAFTGDYATNLTDETEAYIAKVGFTKLGLSVAYKDIEAGAIPAYTTVDYGVGDKGFEYEYTKALGKNTSLTINHQNLDTNPDRTKVTVQVKF